MIATLYYPPGTLPDGTLPELGLICRTRGGTKAIIIGIYGMVEGPGIVNCVMVSHDRLPASHNMSGVCLTYCMQTTARGKYSHLDLAAAWTDADEARLLNSKHLAEPEPRSGEIER